MPKFANPLEPAFVQALQEKVAAMLPGESTRVGFAAAEDDLRATLHAVGLHRVRRWKPETIDEGYAYLQAYKPDLSPVKGVVAIMSLPRYGLCSTFGAVTKALMPLAIPLEQGYGVYWSEVMTEMMSHLMDTHEYILAIDYDSLFDTSDVLHLIRLMEQTPDAGAICGVQMRRHEPSALLSMKDGASQVPVEVFEQELTEVRSAHFGLTVIRSSALKLLSKPWFQAIPDNNGEWKVNAGYTAADIAFWLKFEKEGHKLYQANMVAIGHIFEACAWPSRHLSPVIQSVDDYRKNGVPIEALR